MKVLLSSLALTGALLFSQGVVLAQGWAPPPPTYRVGIAPPPMRVEVRPMQPSPRHFWIDGHWGWDGGRHAWMPGRWEMGRDGYMWVGAHWENRDGFWHYHPGHWRPVGYGAPPQPVY